MSEESCPYCGQEFEVIWGVAIGDSGDYEPVFGGPVTFDTAQCSRCNTGFKRAEGGPWLRRGAR